MTPTNITNLHCTKMKKPAVYTFTSTKLSKTLLTPELHAAFFFFRT
jgi:hypothetical protein